MKLKLDKNFVPAESFDGDEIYQNGIFQWNISKIIKHIEENPSLFQPTPASEIEYYRHNSIRDMDYVKTTDTSIAIILAEINPSIFTVIDGNHRLCKAYHDNLEYINAYKLTVKEHLPFLVTKEGYQAFIQYWNSKVNQLL